uniref:Uncharacterized protein n=1 Tax=Gibberella zeae (strain ATCC MYA-4620 / CBS 123657 / FGSC 9075 / NRRL 31084 / PH-1) TaxID=229533 RepID=A0A098DKN7_GIBZE
MLASGRVTQRLYFRHVQGSGDGFPHNPDIFINPLPQFTLLLASLFFTTSFTFSKIQISHLYWGLSYLPASDVHWTSGQTSSVGPTLLLAQAVRLLSVLAARSELQWLTLTSCSTLRDLSYTSSPSRIAKVWLKATLRVVISAQPCVPDMLVEVKSKIKLYATEHPGDRTAVDMIYYSVLQW